MKKNKYIYETTLIIVYAIQLRINVRQLLITVPRLH